MLLFEKRPPCSLDNKKCYIFRKTDWDIFNDELQLFPFRPFCYSNVDHLDHYWYKWPWEKINTMVTLSTQHRASLQPWIPSSTSNLLKRLNTVASKNPRAFAMIIKRKKLERQVREAMQDEFENFEKTVFGCRVFSRIQK